MRTRRMKATRGEKARVLKKTGKGNVRRRVCCVVLPLLMLLVMVMI